MRAPVVVALSTVVALTACTTGTAAPPATSSIAETAPASSADASPTPPSATAAPEPDRPVVDVALTVAPDLRSVTGRERVEFTPDRTVCRLVFRAWPNKPATAAAGNALLVTAAKVDEVPVTPRTSDAGAPPGSPATLVSLPLSRCAQPGSAVTATLDFRVTLGEGTDERVGTSARDEVAWLGGAVPLLAWESGRGWAREPAVAVAGEMATSEDFLLRRLDVTAPAGLDVLGTGTPTGTRAVGAGTVHSFTAEAVRDVAVTVGRLDVVERDVDGVAVRVGAAARRGAPLEAWADVVERSLRGLTDLLGPFPYDDLWVSVLADQSSGVELPTHVQLGAGDPRSRRWVVSHEVAHQWFYALVGNDQARDPWLDESFAVLAQRIVDGDLDATPADDAAGRVGWSMTQWDAERRATRAYVESVYTAGGSALLRARQLVGAEAFDAALRVYVRENAHSIAVPADVAFAFADLPEVLDELRAVGALPAQ